MGDQEQEQENNGITMWDMVDVVLSADPGHRDEQLLEKLLPWFVARSAVFGGLKKVSLIGMIQNSFLMRCRPDYVLFNQGDIGDCFYVIVRGAVSVYARPTDIKTNNLKRINYARGPQERARFGNELAQLGSGRCFGELSVLKEHGERNATIITDEPTVLICFERKIFLKFVNEQFANELLRKSGFVQTNSLFKKWPLAYKNLLTECLQIRTVEFGETIVKQGDEVTSAYFVIEGQAKISVNTSKHPQQYRGAISKQFDQRLSAYYKNEKDDEDDTVITFPVLERRRRKREEGFFATEMRKRPDVDLCLVVGVNGLIGDIEAVYDVPTYSTTYRCIQAITLYELDIPSFIRLIIKKNPDTFETIRRVAETKIRFRNTAIKGGIPFYSTLLDLSGSGARDRVLPKLFPRLLLQAKKGGKMTKPTVRKNVTISPDHREQRSRAMSRSQKVKMNINPATGEVTVMTSSPTNEERRKSLFQWDEERRRSSILSRETTRGKILPMLNKQLPSLGEENVDENDDNGENRDEERAERDKRGGEAVAKKMAKVKHVGKMAAHFKTRISKKDGDSEKKNNSVDHYKNLKRKMQAMSRITHRVSWNG